VTLIIRFGVLASNDEVPAAREHAAEALGSWLVRGQAA
jgi:hypothetical protein